jgi:flagella basal body P-ring formation protein FlgA
MLRFGLVVVLGLGLLFGSVKAQAVSLGVADMTHAVQTEFVEQGLGNDIELEFFGGQTVFDFPDAAEAKILLDNLEAFVSQGKFTAHAEIFADGRKQADTQLIGRYFVMTEVWVPVRDMAKDEVIKSDDLQKVRMRQNRLRDDDVVASADLVGKQVVRAVKAQKPFTTRDIREEALVVKGQTVTVVYHHKGLQITAKAEVLEDGAKGQKIRLLNTKSQKELRGIVKDKNMVEIEAE